MSSSVPQRQIEQRRQQKTGKPTLHTFTVYVEDKPGVLSRVTGLFSRRAYNIDSLTVSHTKVPGISRLTIVVDANEDSARLVEANLYKLVNVLRVEDVTFEAAVARELALIKVEADADARTKILQICDVFRARVVDATPAALIIESTGTEDKIQSLIHMLDGFGVLELMRSGPITMTRGPDPLTADPHFVRARIANGNGNAPTNNKGESP